MQIEVNQNLNFSLGNNLFQVFIAIHGAITVISFAIKWRMVSPDVKGKSPAATQIKKKMNFLFIEGLSQIV